jgi:hypothetical protein
MSAGLFMNGGVSDEADELLDLFWLPAEACMADVVDGGSGLGSA